MTKNPATIRIAQISCRFDADPDAVGRYIAATVKEHRLHGGMTTECQGDRERKAVERHLGPDFWVRQAGEYLAFGRRTGDVRILPARKTKMKLRRLTHVYTGHSSWRDTYVATQMCRVVVDGRLVRRLLLTSAHLPSGVERPGGMKNNSQTKTHRRAVPKWASTIRSKARKATDRFIAQAAKAGAKVNRAALRVIVAACMDSNLNQHDKQDRDYMRRGMGMPGIWDEGRPRGGTHGSRLIDTIHTNAPVVASGIVRVDPRDYDRRLDHRGVWCELAVGRKPRRSRVMVENVPGKEADR